MLKPWQPGPKHLANFSQEIFSFHDPSFLHIESDSGVAVDQVHVPNDNT